MIEISNLTKRFSGATAVDGISFGVERGEVVGFLGPNGAGKTTAMRILSGYLPPTSGKVEVGGLSVETDSLRVRSLIGYLPENSPLYPEMRVDEYLRFRGALKGLSRRDMKTRIPETKEMCGLQDSGRRIIRHLSRGFQQRVGLADALLHEPELLILDEPTIGLDPNQIRQVREIIKGLAAEHTVLVSTHILSEAEMTCSRILIIDNGRIVAQDTPDNLRGVLFGGIIFDVEVRAEPKDLEEALVRLEGIESVEISSLGAWHRATVHCKPEYDLRSQVSKRMVAHGWEMRELHQKSRSLEDVFVSLTKRGDS